MSFSVFICTFAMSDEMLFDYFCNIKLSNTSDMAKSWAARLCRLACQVIGSAAWLVQELFVAQDIIKVKNYSVEE